jgi:DNA-binding CsgD family transcriptional regulator
MTIEALRTPSYEMRESGIPLLGSTPWGSHICVFYETTDDLLETGTAFFRAGLEANELCVWALPGPFLQKKALQALRRDVADADRYLTSGQIVISEGYERYLDRGEFDLTKIMSGWHTLLETALDRGHEGLRASGEAFWTQTPHWKQFRDYERDLDEALLGLNMIVMCTYPLETSKAKDILDVTRVHQCTIARRHGDWDFVETREQRQAKREMQRLSGALDVMTLAFRNHELLTPRERLVLAHTVRGASAKEIGRALQLSSRTVEFHRKNVMAKLGASNIVELVRIVLSQ